MFFYNIYYILFEYILWTIFYNYNKFKDLKAKKL